LRDALRVFLPALPPTGLHVTTCGFCAEDVAMFEYIEEEVAGITKERAR
jgi:hypothetical protein